MKKNASILLPIKSLKKAFKHDLREHPHLKVIVVEDVLASNAPHINCLEDNNMKYILGAKRGDYEFLFDQVEDLEDTQYYEYMNEKGFLYQFSFHLKTELKVTSAGTAAI